MQSWIGVVSATGSKCLLGGVRHHESARFETRSQAVGWALTVQGTNTGAGRGAEWNVRPSAAIAEINEPAYDAREDS